MQKSLSSLVKSNLNQNQMKPITGHTELLGRALLIPAALYATRCIISNLKQYRSSSISFLFINNNIHNFLLYKLPMYLYLS